MGQKFFYSIVAILVIYASLVFAVPGIPHQFYGNVEVNDQPVPDNTVIIATVEGDTYTTVTTDSKYGYSPNIFYVEDPNGNRGGTNPETINFFIGGKEVRSYVFENNGYTKLDFSLTTDCDDGYCLGNETCSSCPEDCGYCTGPPVITIHSPESNKVYDTLKVDLDVSAEGIIVWMYSLNTADPITFKPNITITAQEGNNSIDVIGINNVYQSGTKTVSFSVELPQPYCGDGICNVNETCSTCPEDCGACPPSGGGGGGGGSSCTPKWECTAWTECLPEGKMTRTCTDKNNCRTTAGKPVESQSCNYVPPKTTKTQEEEKPTEEETTTEEVEPVLTEGEGMQETTGAVVVTDTTEEGLGGITGRFFQNITGSN